MRTVHDLGVAGIRVPRVLAAGLGAALQAADVLVEFGAEGATQAALKARSAAEAADRAYRAAARRGDLTLRRAAAGAADRVDQAVDEAGVRLGRAADAAAAWTDREVVRRVARSTTPYLVEELVPGVVEGVMPVVRAVVVPDVVEDLAGDARIRAMVAQQSRGVLTWSVTEVRRASTEADDRVETSLRHLLGRRGVREG